MPVPRSVLELGINITEVRRDRDLNSFSNSSFRTFRGSNLKLSGSATEGHNCDCRTRREAFPDTVDVWYMDRMRRAFSSCFMCIWLPLPCCGRTSPNSISHVDSRRSAGRAGARTVETAPTLLPDPTFRGVEPADSAGQLNHQMYFISRAD